MCIIIYKPAGIVPPSLTTLGICAHNHPDGSGMMWPKKGNIRIHKGFLRTSTIHAFLVKNIMSDVVVHFRTATDGPINIGNAQPFPVTQNIRVLLAERAFSKVGFAHNGIVQGNWGRRELATYSDTALMIRYILYSHINDINLLEFIARSSYSKFAVMHPRRVHMIGNWFEDGGLYFSNQSYRYYGEVKHQKVYVSYPDQQVCSECSGKNVIDYGDIIICDTCGWVW